MFTHGFFRMVGEFTGVARSIYEGLIDYEEPEIYYVVVEGCESLKKYAPFIRCGGAGIDLHEAMERAFGEFIERYCLMFYLEENPHIIEVATYDKLVARGENVVSLDKVQMFSAHQYRSRRFPFQRPTKDTLLGWVKGFSLISGKEIFVPAQHVYLGYNRQHGEPLICPTTTSGAAAGASYESAILRATYELIERDAVMRAWYFKKVAQKLQIAQVDQKDELQLLIKRIKEKRFLYSLLLLQSALSCVYAVLVCMINPENQYPKFIVGGSANLNPAESCYKALLEAVQGIPYAKMLALTYYDTKIDPMKIADFDLNIVFYGKPENFDYVSFLLATGDSVNITTLKNNSHGEELKDLRTVIGELRRENVETIVFDATLQNVKDVGYHVVKVYSPQLVPLSLPSYPFLGHGLMRGAENKMPHPYP